MSPKKAFLSAAAVAVFGYFALLIIAPFETTPPKHLQNDIAVRGQITLGDVKKLANAGYKTIVSLRPDGESVGQPSSASVAEAARAAGINFAYIPTPRGEIPDSVPDKLSETLKAANGPVLLYCGSGQRASRVWALSEAAKPDGASADDIEKAVTGVGQSITDLKNRIDTRIANRSTAPAAVE